MTSSSRPIRRVELDAGVRDRQREGEERAAARFVDDQRGQLGEAVDSGLHAPMALVGPVAQADQPRLGMTEVIARLLDRLLGDPGQLGVGGR